MESWKSIEKRFLTHSGRARIHTLNGREATAKAIADAIRENDTDFIIAGGDGTVNTVLNTLLEHSSPDQVSQIRIGAIGLGSSNDFHKPFRPDQIINGISVKVDFDSAQLRDVGQIRFDDNGRQISKYFLINASVGVTAEANKVFNHPGAFLRLLKRLHTPSAILYAAMSTIIEFEPFDVRCKSDAAGAFKVSLSNLGVIKNPHFSGNLSYGEPAVYDDGEFTIKMCHDMSTLDLLRLFRSLGRGGHGRNVKSWQSSSLSIRADRPFSVEYDGEVITTSSAEFSVLPKHLKVCP